MIIASPTPKRTPTSVTLVVAQGSLRTPVGIAARSGYYDDIAVAEEGEGEHDSPTGPREQQVVYHCGLQPCRQNMVEEEEEGSTERRLSSGTTTTTALAAGDDGLLVGKAM